MWLSFAYPRIRSTRSFAWFLCVFNELPEIERCLACACVSTFVYGISRNWSSVIPDVSTRSNCKCFASSLDQMRARPSDGDLDGALKQWTMKNKSMERAAATIRAVATNLFFLLRRLRWLLLWCESVSLLWCFDPDKLLFIDEADCIPAYDSFWCRCASCHWLFVSSISIDPVDFRCPEKLRVRLPSLSEPDSVRRCRERCRRCLRCCDRPEPRDNSLSLSDVRRLRCRCLSNNFINLRSTKTEQNYEWNLSTFDTLSIHSMNDFRLNSI